MFQSPHVASNWSGQGCWAGQIPQRAETERKRLVRVSELGEFALIDRLTARLPGRPDVLVAAGDDAAVLTPVENSLLVVTCDAQVEGRHFLPHIATPEEIGHKALAVNLSDIAAMGATPAWALVSLLLQPDCNVDLVEGIYSGMRQLASRFGVAIVGGNISATTGPLTIDVTAIGSVRREQVVRRKGARAGDAILVTGTLGAAGMAVHDALHPGDLPSELRTELRQAMVAPEPQCRAGIALDETGVVTSMLDISDGLAADLGHLCDASGSGAIVEAARIPVDIRVRAAGAALSLDPMTFALYGGEDYQLLFTVPDIDVDTVLRALAKAEASAVVIGHMTSGPAELCLRLPDGHVESLPRHGWDHLRNLDQ